MPSPLLPVALAVAAAYLVWFTILAALLRATRTPPPVAGPATADLGPESPALAALATRGWNDPRGAAAATLLDLAARRVVSIEQIGPDLSLVRLRRDADTSPLNPYERLVLDHVTRLATADGVVATAALAEGARNLGNWWGEFHTAVLDEARAAGLTQPRWGPAHKMLLSLAAVLPALATGLPVVAALTPAAARDGGDVISFAIAAAIAFTVLHGVHTRFVLNSVRTRLGRERGTALGQRVAGRWLGVREHLAQARLDEVPAAGVTIWGRALAYAAALGSAGHAVASLPVDRSGHSKDAWSDYGGMWHQVEVSYRGPDPLRRALWGHNLGGGLQRVAFQGFVVVVPLFVLASVAVLYLGTFAGVLFLAVPAGLLVVCARAVLLIADAVDRRTVRGQVVRLVQEPVLSFGPGPQERWFVALDTGGTRFARAFGTDERTWQRLTEGDIVEAEVGKWMGWMHRAQVLQPSRRR